MGISSTAAAAAATDAEASTRPAPPADLPRRAEPSELASSPAQERRSEFASPAQLPGLRRTPASPGGLAFVPEAALPAGGATPVPPVPEPSAVREAALELDRRPRLWLQRAHRVLLLLVVVWGLNGFDLGFTLHQARSLHFVEMNPLAARLLDAPAAALFLYKFSLVAAGTVILVSLRRHAVAELACWFLLAAYFYVAARWFVYYERALAMSEDALLHVAS